MASNIGWALTQNVSQANSVLNTLLIDVGFETTCGFIPQALTIAAAEQAALEARMAALMTAKHRTPVIAIAGW